MKIYYKMYKHCDADLYSIRLAGISVSSLMKISLVYRAAGKRLHIFIPRCLPCDIDGLNYMIGSSFHISEPDSIRFIKEEIKPRYRTRYLKILLRQSLVNQMSGVCFKHGSQVEKENTLNNSVNIEQLNDLLVLMPGTFKKKYTDQIIRCTLPEKLIKALKNEERDDEANGFDYVDDKSGNIISEWPDNAEAETDNEDDENAFPGL